MTYIQSSLALSLVSRQRAIIISACACVRNYYHLIERLLYTAVQYRIRSRERGDRDPYRYRDTMADFLKEVNWGSFKPWLVPAAGAVVAAYLLYKVVRIARADCDLTLLSRKLKAGYFTGKVVWVTGASSGSTFICCIAVSSPLD